MIVYDCKQNTPEWLQLRSGIPTTSEFDRIITPKGNPSQSSTTDKFLYELIAERLMGHPRAEAIFKWGQRGKELEAEAASSYEFVHDVETVPVGFITNDAGTAGSSPDRLVGDVGLLEVKCPSEGEHCAYLLEEGAVYGKYMVQCQGQLYIAEKQWTDLISYHPEMPKAEVRIERDENFIEKLAKQLQIFIDQLADIYADCVERGWAKPLEKAPPSLQDILRESLEAINN